MPSRELFTARFLQHWHSLALDPGARLLVALSGGRDSVTLLHLLRFVARLPAGSLVAAHVDHALRPYSAADAAWVAGLCRAWQVPLARERLGSPPRNEAEARRERWHVLRRAAAEAGAALVVTAHHADDQAETVLFRALRGTGLRGLGGMAAREASGIVRPLLPFWRAEIARYAAEYALAWREDETNALPGAARNRLRHELLPWVEREIAPGARRSLVRLAALAAEAEAQAEREAERAALRVAWRDGERFVLARDLLRGYDSAAATRILRHVLRQLGTVPSRAGTRVALQFITGAPSGRAFPLPGGLWIRTEFEHAVLGRAGAEEQGAPERPAEIARGAPAGEGEACIAGRTYWVRWALGAPAEVLRTPSLDAPWCVELESDALRFPLRVRGWQPGDRMRTAAGTKRLKKLFAEWRVPLSRRVSLPVLVDADGAVLWAAGGGVAVDAQPRAAAALRFRLSITHD